MHCRCPIPMCSVTHTHVLSTPYSIPQSGVWVVFNELARILESYTLKETPCVTQTLVRVCVCVCVCVVSVCE